MNLQELNISKKLVRQQMQQLENIKPSCMSCEHFSSGSKCGHFKAEPPPEWRNGPVECDAWNYDYIPF